MKMNSRRVGPMRSRSPNAEYKKPEHEQDSPVACRSVLNPCQHKLHIHYRKEKLFNMLKIFRTLHVTIAKWSIYTITSYSSRKLTERHLTMKEIAISDAEIQILYTPQTPRI